MRKKSQIAAHFHWIFILIAGALILTFFVTIVVKQKDISEQKIAGKAITGLDQIFTAASMTEDTLNIIEIPKIELEFICKENYSEYSIRKTGLNRNLGTEIIFSPDIVKGEHILVWTLAWSMPYRIDNFVMITSPEVRYIIIYDNDNDYNEEKAWRIFDDIPDQINKEIILLSRFQSLTSENNYKIRLIFVIEQNIESINLPDWMQDVSAVKITNQFVKFYKKQDSSLSSEYEDTFPIRIPFPKADSKDPMLYSAVFAENSEMYKCAMKKAYKRLAIVTKIYETRINNLISYYKNPANFSDIPPEYIPQCYAYYYEGYYPALITQANSCFDNPNNADYFVNLLKTAGYIKQDNDGLVGDCPLIY